jgi:hypothetical protein
MYKYPEMNPMEEGNKYPVMTPMEEGMNKEVEASTTT